MLRKSKSDSVLAVPKEKVIGLYRAALTAGVPLEILQQKISTFLLRAHTTLQIEEKDDYHHQQRVKKQSPLLSRIIFHVLPALFISTGIFLVGNAVWPIFSFYLLGSADVSHNSLLSPIPREQVLEELPSMVTKVQANTIDVQPTIIEEELDYTNLTNWFPSDSNGLNTELAEDQKSVEYRLDIPAVNIENARVKVGGTNLDRSLIQYPGTSLPGEEGSPVIFGHSVLRQFYNPSINNPHRYISLFSKIMTLKLGDKIYVTQDNVRYTYVVKDKRDVKPEDTFILSQNYDVKELKLITCRPEGTFFLRGVVTAELESTQ